MHYFTKPKKNVFLLLAVFSLTSCVTKQQRQENVPSERDPIQSESPSTSPKEKEKPQYSGEKFRRRQPITLVLGGAGVASFATVGILKKLEEARVPIAGIIATGWPALFALGYGFLGSVHHLEWMAMRLSADDFYASGLFQSSQGFSDHSRIRELASKHFKVSSLSQSKVPIILSATQVPHRGSEAFSTGSWMEPFLKAISVPGIFRPYPGGSGLGWVSFREGLDVQEARRRGKRAIVAVSMYDDFLGYQLDTRKKSQETLYRVLYTTELREQIEASLRLANRSTRIRLGRAPLDFAAKRAAILAGYRQATELLGPTQ